MAEEEVAGPLEIESPQECPPTPVAKTRAPRKKKEAPAAAPVAEKPDAPMVVDADFWGALLATRREMDRVARVAQLSNLVRF